MSSPGKDRLCSVEGTCIALASAMTQSIRAGLLYFVMVFSLGFLLGMT